ncbi:unnamed protein product [Brachionus calyciflorus]|uniref:Neurite outgrowth-associated protein n=1 Tax=Brachionus calyciflorus TaxID=104777 RepID=A0A813PKQ6_9BILA|nr:unnamed protein product [Brachionus calyciflorus]
MLGLMTKKFDFKVFPFVVQISSRREIRETGRKNPFENSLIRTNKDDNRNSTKKTKDENFFAIGSVSSQGNKFKKFKLPLNLINEEKKFINKGKSSRIADELSNRDPESLIKDSEDLDLYVKNEDLYHRKIVEEDIKKNKRIKLGIVKKRIDKIENRDEKNFNLLTWDAKEQIKHLHINDPQTWTPERISESFPITLQSCKKLLKSKWTPKTLDELERHDEKVMENWKSLEKIENNINSAGPVVNIYREYKKMNRLNLLKNAAGLPGVNFERKSLIFSDSYAVHESLLCEPGKFSKIVVHKDDSIKKLFNRKNEENELNNSKELKERSELFQDHLLVTKNQLSKSLDKIFSSDKKTERKS